MTRTLIILIGTFLLHSCRPPAQHSSDSQQLFEWDLEAENHTGMSRDAYSKDGKHRGMTAFNWQNERQESINQLVKDNIEWIALVPFLFQENARTKQVRPRERIGAWTRRDSVYMQIAADFHSRDVHIMLKPHIWMHEGWRAEIQLDNDAEWDTWFDAYSRHMIHYALLAERAGVELYCIGTELRSSINQQPARWDSLIADIKEVYTGKLTYAANWDGEYDEVQFWDEMDYIGLQAYFPLTSNIRPSLQEIEKGWIPHRAMLEQLSERHQRPILFTETGYRSDESATVRPWEWGIYQDTTGLIVCNETQLYAYEALFRQLWHEEWFAGVYFWQWHNRHDSAYTVNNVDFTPRYKPAENALARWYGK